MRTWMTTRFGTWRGLLRLLLAYAELALGRPTPFELQHPERVRRVVYVCLGNICRSAYGVQIARDCGLHATSLGLSTCTGAASPTAALDAARRQGVDLSGHRARDWRDFSVQPGDLFLVMELRHAHQLRRRLGPRKDVEIVLLGMWCSPPVPHLHDPYTLSDSYFDTCFARVRQATLRLSQRLASNARAPTPRRQPRLEPE